jgi:predicted ribosome quality control (RQC) complex YloA/Tae2 family protein
MDALTLRALCMDLNRRLKLARVDKIHQPSERDLIFTLRTREATHRLLLSAHKTFARAHLFTGERPKNPEEPPMFCMLLRKRLESGRLLEVRQQGWDRVLEFVFESLNEIGDTVQHVLILEVMGKHSNLILTTANDAGQPERIVDSIVHVTREMSRVRQVLPGLPYQPAPPQNKKSYLEVTVEDVAALELSEKSGKRKNLALCGLVAGIGPTAAREILYRAGSAEEGVPVRADAVVRELRSLVDGVLHGTEHPSIGLDELGIPAEAAPYALHSYPSFRAVESLSDALQLVYAEAVGRVHTSNLSRDLENAVLAHLDRLRGKRQKMQEQHAESQDFEQYRIQGELLTAYAHLVQKGATEVTLPNFYDDEKPLTIPLDPALSATHNAQRYFRLASKKKRALPLLEKELEQIEQDMQYLENILVYLQDANAEQLQALRDELEKEGFLQPKATRKRRSHPQKRASGGAGTPDVYVSSDGYTIRVGRNNAQNDRLTLKSSQPFDIWLHVKDMPGSHVVITANRGTEVPERTLEEAALLAAYFSKGRNSANVPVDFTQIRHVWKPNGARPGHVLYDHQKTLYVTPERGHVEEILRRKQ